MATVTALAAFGIALGGTAAQAHPAAFTKCSGHYKVKDATPKGKISKHWEVEINEVTEMGTTCSNARAVAGQYAQAVCGECAGNYNRTIAGYRYKYQATDNLEGDVTAKKGTSTVKFVWYTNPA